MEFEVVRVNKGDGVEEVQFRQVVEAKTDEQGNALPGASPANFPVYINDPAQQGQFQEGQRFSFNPVNPA